MPQLDDPSLLISALLSRLPDHDDHWQALITEQAVKESFSEEGLPVASFGLWALRRRAERKDIRQKMFFRPKDWTWLAFAPDHLQALPRVDQEVLAFVARRLHGLSYVQWSVDDLTLRYATSSVKAVQVGQHFTPVLRMSRRHPPLQLSFPAVPATFSGESLIPDHVLLAALVESFYVECVEAADGGAFTNVDVLAWDGTRPIVAEVKRRARHRPLEAQELTLTYTQAETLHALREAGAEVHVTALIHPTQGNDPHTWLTTGHWRKGLRPLRPRLENVLVPLSAPLAALSLAELRRVPEGPRPLEVDRTPTQQAGAPAPPPLQNVRKTPPVVTTPRLKPQPRLTKFSGEYEFLQVWSPAPVNLGGRPYLNVAAAYVAASTLDQGAREHLTSLSRPAEILPVARRLTRRDDWPALQEKVAWEILRFAYRGERGQWLVQTLPFQLADEEVFDPLLIGIQGRPGLRHLERRRGDLAELAVHQSRPCCGLCRFAAPSREPGFAVCQLPGLPESVLGCVGKAAFQGLRGGPPRVAITTPAGQFFQAGSEETIPGW